MDEVEVDGTRFTKGQSEAMRALLEGRNVFLSGNAGTGKSFVLDAFIGELEKRHVPYLAMAPTGIAALNLRNGTTIHRTLRIGHGLLDPHDLDRRTLNRKVLDKAKVVIIDEISMCRIDLFERVMNMVLTTNKKGRKKQVVVAGDFFQLPPVVTDAERGILLSWYPGNEEGYAFKSLLWQGMAFEPHVLTEVVRQSDPEFIGQLNRARVGDRGCVGYFNGRSISDRRRAPVDDLWLCATNRMASTINDEHVDALREEGRPSRTYRAVCRGDVKPSDKATDDNLRLVEGARVMLLANMPDDGLSNGSLGTVVSMTCDHVTVDFDDCPYEVDVEAKEWKVLKSTIRETVGEDGKPTQELVTDTVGTFTQIPLRLAFAITIHKSQGQTFERCAVHTKVFGAGMLYVALSRCTTYGGLTIWPKIEPDRLYANRAVVDFYRSLEQPEDSGSGQMALESDMVTLSCPRSIASKVRAYIDLLMRDNEAVHSV